jgi:DNA-binding TFAR19-related protein (PDSD5 family)
MQLHKSMMLTIVAIMLTVGVANAQVKQLITEEQLKGLLMRVDTSTVRFAESADKAMDKAGFDGTAREDDLNNILQRFKSATAALATDHTAATAKNNFEKVLHYGVSIENFLKRNPLDGVEEDWVALRADLGELAKGFNITWDQGHAIGAPISEADVKNLLQHIEDKADKYKLALDAALDNSVLNNTPTEDEINRINSEFRAATRKLEDNRKDRDGAQGPANEVLTQGKRIDAFLEKHKEKLTPEVASSWLEVRTDLLRLARLYSIVYK